MEYIYCSAKTSLSNAFNEISKVTAKFNSLDMGTESNTNTVVNNRDEG